MKSLLNRNFTIYSSSKFVGFLCGKINIALLMLLIDRVTFYSQDVIDTATSLYTEKRKKEKYIELPSKYLPKTFLMYVNDFIAFFYIAFINQKTKVLLYYRLWHIEFNQISSVMAFLT